MRIATLTALLLLSPFAAVSLTAQDEKDQTPTLHSNVNLVSVYFTVRDNHKQLASDLPRERFRITEDGKPQTIKFFAHHSDVVLNVGVLLDTGTNMAWMLNQEADASTLFLEHVVRSQDLGFALGYASRVETIQVPTSDVETLNHSIDRIRSQADAMELPNSRRRVPTTTWPIPGTSGPTGIPIDNHREAHLYDALRVSTVRYLKNEVGRKAVVVIALSGDSQSESSFDDALATLLENDVIAYVLQIYDALETTDMDHCDVRHTYSRDDHGEEFLRKLAEATGGRMLEVHGMKNIAAALDQISDELHHQYSLGYYPENQVKDGKFRKLQIVADPQGFKVFARKGYYAPKPQ